MATELHNEEIQDEVLTAQPLASNDEKQLGAVVYGQTVLTDGHLQSSDFVTGTSGWQIQADGDVEFNDGNFRGDITGASGTFSGTLTGGSLNIPDITTANSFHVDTTGNAWWGTNVATGYATANAYVLSTGVAHFASISLDTDVVLSGLQAGSSLAIQYLTAGSITSKAITLDVTDGSGDSYIAAGKTDFTNTDSGFILGVDDSDGNKAKFYIGDATHYLNWDGASFTLAGTYVTLNGNLFLGSGCGGAIEVGGIRNTCLGENAGAYLNTGDENIFIGYGAGALATSAFGNICIGSFAGYSNQTSNTNVFIGNYAGYTATTANNVAIGYFAGKLNTGTNNIFLGYNAGNQTTGGTNTIIGASSGVSNLTGGGNVFLGFSAGFYETGSDKLFIDNQSRTNEATARTNSLIYGVFHATPSSQTLTTNSAFTATYGVNIPTGQTYKINNTALAVGDITGAAPLASPTFTGNATFDTVKITGGTPGAGQVLTSDADGDATWEVPNTTDIQTFTSTGTWTKPSAGSMAFIQCWGGGGSGGRAGANDGGGGGGGGAYVEAMIPVASLGATETVTIGDGGAVVTSDNTDGNAGGSTTFGSFVTAYGGGGGGGNTADNGGGGGGGGTLSVGGTGAGATPAAGGSPQGGSAATGSVVAGQSSFGGGGGGYPDDGYETGGISVYGGAGGGAGATATVNTGNGGASVYGGGGGGGCDASGGTNGTGGASNFGGAGGAGAYDANNATAGSVPGGGGGGSETGNSGAGGKGKCIVTTF